MTIPRFQNAVRISAGGSSNVEHGMEPSLSRSATTTGTKAWEGSRVQAYSDVFLDPGGA